MKATTRVSVSWSPTASGTELRQDLKTKRVMVEVRLLARMPNSAWQTVWKHSEFRDASKPRPEAAERIANDPRVKKVLDLAKAVGSQEADDAVKLAMRFGAASTCIAQ